jgi:hypothetical protein
VRVVGRALPAVSLGRLNFNRFDKGFMNSTSDSISLDAIRKSHEFYLKFSRRVEASASVTGPCFVTSPLWQIVIGPVSSALPSIFRRKTGPRARVVSLASLVRKLVASVWKISLASPTISHCNQDKTID